MAEKKFEKSIGAGNYVKWNVSTSTDTKNQWDHFIDGSFTVFDSNGSNYSFDLFRFADSKTPVSKDLKPMYDLMDAFNQYLMEYAKAVNTVKAQLKEKEVIKNARPAKSGKAKKVD